MYIFNFLQFTCKFKKHHYGIIAILTRENFEGDIKIGINKDNNIYRMRNFKWININEVNIDSGGNDVIYINDNYYTGPSGLVQHIFDKHFVDINIDDVSKEILIKLVDDMLNDRSLHWLPSADYYTFEESDLVAHNKNS